MTEGATGCETAEPNASLRMPEPTATTSFGSGLTAETPGRYSRACTAAEIALSWQMTDHSGPRRGTSSSTGPTLNRSAPAFKLCWRNRHPYVDTAAARRQDRLESSIIILNSSSAPPITSFPALRKLTGAAAARLLSKTSSWAHLTYLPLTLERRIYPTGLPRSGLSPRRRRLLSSDHD
ncbi:hypothetical protein PtA15_12A170 [Puccinia triticina]|uniref:Uncharacterized protein n=1 Tax=Puccinia triticina TaxID=208348 RepID=A0ABY7CY03_9BASI|nr:uncharacterized protein PtA15_12A170 [Puccinia triticina]WAQ90184.1 hypothetical protein PtA15_12A170 [Puccinia triticina]WAR61474.1 hypothetical protein PtB15_12B159 [Puccinia triticina]